jgi:hypothetical protein
LHCRRAPLSLSLPFPPHTHIRRFTTTCLAFPPPETRVPSWCRFPDHARARALVLGLCGACDSCRTQWRGHDLDDRRARWASECRRQWQVGARMEDKVVHWRCCPGCCGVRTCCIPCRCGIRGWHDHRGAGDEVHAGSDAGRHAPCRKQGGPAFGQRALQRLLSAPVMPQAAPHNTHNTHTHTA